MRGTRARAVERRRRKEERGGGREREGKGRVRKRVEELSLREIVLRSQ